MDNQEILATLRTKDNQEWTIRRYWQRKEQRAIKNGQTGDTGNIRNKGLSRMDNQEYTGNFRNKGQSGMDNQEYTGNIRNKGQSRMDNQEILATIGTKGNQEWTIRRYWQR